MVLKYPIIHAARRRSRSDSKTDPVLNSTNTDISSEAILRNLRRTPQSLSSKRPSKCRTTLLLAISITATLCSATFLVYTPLQMILNFILEMTPGWPPYEWWRTPIEQPLLKAYFFNITNSERFLSGQDTKLKLEEIGPIVYRENVEHLNPQRLPNGTLTYTASRSVEFLPERNTINLQDTVIVPNLAVLLIPAYFHGSSYFLKMAINMLMNSYNSKPFVSMTIEQYLWNTSDPILGPAKKLAPSLVPSQNVGILNIVYMNFVNNVTLFIGKKYGHSKFFSIDKYDGSEYLPHFSDPTCQVKFSNASEGLVYPQMITKESNLSFWRKSVCKQSDIRYVRDDVLDGVNVYRFELARWTYNRVEWEGNKDCFAGFPALPDGVIDASRCYWGFPIVISFPHFLHADKSASAHLEGLNPNEGDHSSYVYIEPMTGLPMQGRARAQVNLLLRDMSGFNRHFQRLGNKIIPLAWLEYHQEGIPWYVQRCLYVLTVVLPTLQMPLSIFCLIAGSLCAFFLVTPTLRNKSQHILLQKVAVIKKEKEALMDKVHVKA